MPIDAAASRKPPVDLIQLPKLVSDSIAVARIAIADEPDERQRGTVRPARHSAVNSQLGRSAGSSGGKPPEITTVSERAMNSMPSVVMKLGMAKLQRHEAVDEADRGADERGPSSNAGEKGTPAISMTRHRHRHQREHRADRKVELAADHQDA